LEEEEVVEVFEWKPWKIGFSDETEFNVLISKFESDYEQRRKKNQRSLRAWTYLFHRKTAGSFVDDAILDFYEARGGQTEAFYLPSFAEETTLLANYTTGTNVNIASTSKFSDDPFARNNLICLQNASNIEVKKITEVVDSTNVTIESAFTYDYNTTTGKVHRAYKVRFAQPFTRNSIFDSYYRTEVRFQEVF
jgi:hypothetical protein